MTGNAASGALTYSESNGNVTQANATSIPWSLMEADFASGDSYSISAQDADPNGATITCTVLEDGHQIAQETATGPRAIADCHGEVL